MAEAHVLNLANTQDDVDFRPKIGKLDAARNYEIRGPRRQSSLFVHEVANLKSSCVTANRVVAELKRQRADLERRLAAALASHQESRRLGSPFVAKVRAAKVTDVGENRADEETIKEWAEEVANTNGDVPGKELRHMAPWFSQATGQDEDETLGMMIGVEHHRRLRNAEIPLLNRLLEECNAANDDDEMEE